MCNFEPDTTETFNRSLQCLSPSSFRPCPICFSIGTGRWASTVAHPPQVAGHLRHDSAEAAAAVNSAGLKGFRVTTLVNLGLNYLQLGGLLDDSEKFLVMLRVLHSLPSFRHFDHT